MSEKEIIDLIGNIDVSMLMDKIVEKDMKCRKKLDKRLEKEQIKLARKKAFRKNKEKTMLVRSLGVIVLLITCVYSVLHILDSEK